MEEKWPKAPRELATNRGLAALTLGHEWEAVPIHMVRWFPLTLLHSAMYGMLIEGHEKQFPVPGKL